jgi:putative flavoprotein involved in K+ transport
MERRDVVVVGAGSAGLATAAMLKRAGVPAIVLERAPHVAASWRERYDRLHLHTVRWLSDLPGYPLERSYGRWVSRDGMVEYLERYAEHHELEVRVRTEAKRIDRTASGWHLHTTAGPIEANVIVVATGYSHDPFVPDWPGRERFPGELTHSSEYRNPTRYRGRDVLVVGSGNSGAEIAVDLAEGGAGRVRLAVRTPPNIFRRQAFGVPSQLIAVLVRRLPVRIVDPVGLALRRVTVGDLSAYGLPAPEGAYTKFLATDVIPILDVGLIEAVKGGAVEVVGGVEGFDEQGHVVLEGGRRMAPDAIIAATGYRRGLEPLVGHLSVLTPAGRPAVHGARTHPDAPDLYFVGFTNPISGHLREVGIDARKIARAIAGRRSARREAA